MSPIDLERLFQSFRPDRRGFLRTLVLGTAYTAPLVSSFSMDGLVRAAAAGTISNLCSNTTLPFSNATNLSQVAVSKTVSPEPVIAGNQLTYTIVLENCGVNSAANRVGVSFTDTLPAGLLFVSAQQVSGSPTFTLTLPAAGSEGGTVSGVANAIFPFGAVVVFEIVAQVKP